MTVPALLFGILVSTLMGAATHLIFGGSIWKLVLYIFLGWFGFWGGHYLAAQLGVDFLAVGPLKFGPALLGAAVLLAIGYWLGLDRAVKAKK